LCLFLSVEAGKVELTTTDELSQKVLTGPSKGSQKYAIYNIDCLAARLQFSWQ
jgi:hypothetical protein